MFDHTYHNLINSILISLDESLFLDTGAYFGGGTLISLLHGEYRWSKDIDFICPVGPGYKKLRSLVFESSHRPEIFFKTPEQFQFPRDLMATQYGIRFLVVADNTPIKFEIVAEARIKLNEPEFHFWNQLPCLCFDDQCTEKLLANSDRWIDSSIASRDLIDLAMLRNISPFSTNAIEKAEQAQPTVEPLKRAITHFQNKPEHRKKCYEALEIKAPSKVIDGLDLLAMDFRLPETKRLASEEAKAR